MYTYIHIYIFYAISDNYHEIPCEWVKYIELEVLWIDRNSLLKKLSRLSSINPITLAIFLITPIITIIVQISNSLFPCFARPRDLCTTVNIYLVLHETTAFGLNTCKHSSLYHFAWDSASPFNTYAYSTACETYALRDWKRSETEKGKWHHKEMGMAKRKWKKSSWIATLVSTMLWL